MLRIGARGCNNFSADWQDLHKVFWSIKIAMEHIQNHKLIFLLDVCAMDAEEETKDRILRIVQEHVPVHAHRISSQALGECQTDSLVKTFEWEQSQVAKFDQSNVTGCFVLRADCYLKPFIALQSWLDHGMQDGMCVFPFKVWDENAPADQLFFIPKSQREDFVRSVTTLSTKYRPSSLNRMSLHYMYCKSCLNGRLSFHCNVVCDANSSKEWNPYYRIMGRSEKQQEERHRTKWGDHWFLGGGKCAEQLSLRRAFLLCTTKAAPSSQSLLLLCTTPGIPGHAYWTEDQTERWLGFAIDRAHETKDKVQGARTMWSEWAGASPYLPGDMQQDIVELIDQELRSARFPSLHELV